MRFTFIHAADLHLDSPLAGLGLKDKRVAERFAQAGRRAFEALVQETISSKASFLIIAGDIFDGDWKDIATGLFFVRAISALHREGIPVFMVKGNHDAASVMSRDLPYPETARTFASETAETFLLSDLRVALHGRSFPNRLTGEFVETYPARRDGWLNIGILHTSLDGSRGHEGYAPCTVDELKRFGYDYWALGHVHAAEIVHRDPWMVYPGNLQGRSVRETGAKGAMRVTVDDGRVVDVTPIILDDARWAAAPVDVAGVDSEDQVMAGVDAMLAGMLSSSEGRSLALRLTLTGVTGLHNRLVAHREMLQDEIRARAFQFADDVWIESLKIATTPPPRLAGLSGGLDNDQLLAEAAADPEFAIVLSGLIEAIKAKLPKDLHVEIDQPDMITTLAADSCALLSGESM